MMTHIWRLFCILAATQLLACSPPDEEQAKAYVVHGDLAVEQQKFRDATIEYRNAVKYAPNDATIRWKLVQATLQAADLEASLKELHNLLRIDPGHANARLLLGRLYLSGAKRGEAVRVAKDLTLSLPDHPSGYLLEGELAVQSGDFREAIRQFERAHDCDASLLQPILAAANVSLLLQDYARAAQWYQQALDSHPESVDVHIARGNYFFAVGDEAKADREFEWARTLGLESEAARLGIVVQHLARGRQEHAIRELQALTGDMTSRKGRALLAELFLESGRNDEGQAVIEALAGTDPRDAITLYLKGRLALIQQRRVDARALLSQAIALQGAKAGPHLWLGQLELIEGHMEQGEALLQKAAQLDQEHALTHVLLAKLYLKQHRYERAETEALEVLRRNPAHLEAALLYGDSHAGRDNWGQAETIYARIRDQLPSSSLGYRKLGQLARRQGLAAKAATFYAQAVAQEPGDADTMLQYLLSLEEANERRKADYILKKFVSDMPYDPRRWETAARFHRSKGHLDEARAAWLRMSELRPDEPRPYYELAQLDLAQQKPGDGERLLRRALAHDPRFGDAWTALGILLTSQGSLDEANRCYRYALEAGEFNPVAANNLAANLVEQGADLDDALRYGIQALTAAPAAPSVMDTVGWIHYKQGAWEKAALLLADAADQMAEDPVVHYHYGMVLVRRGEKALAVRELEAALAVAKEFPGSREAELTLASLR